MDIMTEVEDLLFSGMQAAEKDDEKKRRDKSRGSHGSSEAVRRGSSGSRPGSRAGSSGGRLRRSRSPPRRRDGDGRGSRRREDRDDRGGGDFYRGGGRQRTVSGEPGGDSYRPGSSNNTSSRRRDREPDRDRDQERDRPRRGDDRHTRGYDRRYEGDRRKRRPSVEEPRKKEKTPAPAPNDDERDSRTVFVQQLAARLRTRDLTKFFENCGPVKDSQIVKDRVSHRSKGVGYVEFMEEESVSRALQLTGQKLLGIPIIVQLTEAEKNRQQRTTDGSTNAQNAGVPFHRLYVGNIHFSITEDDLTNVFEPFGELEFVQLQKEEQGRSKGYGFVQYRDPAAAKEALEKMNGFDLAGRPIRVGLGNDKFTDQTTQNLLQRFPAHQQSSAVGIFGSGGRGTHAGGDVSYESKGRREDRGGIGNASALNDTDVGESNLANISRHDIMRKLLRSEDSTAVPTSSTTERAKPMKRAAPAPPPMTPQVSRCIVLTNMYDPAEEEARSGPTWKKTLLEEIETECTGKFGKLVHIDTDPNTAEIYLKFRTIESGGKAVQGLNGRHFAGRMIAAAPIIEAVYNSHWNRAINL